MQTHLVNLMYEQDSGQAYVEKALIVLEAANRLPGEAAMNLKAPTIRFDFNDG